MTTTRCSKCNSKFTPTEFVLFDISTRCPHCRLQMGEQYAAMEWSELHWQSRLELARIPERFRVLQPGKLLQKVDAVVSGALTSQKPLWLTGDVETGKTLTLACLAIRLIHYAVPVLYVNVPHFSNWLRLNSGSQLEQNIRFSTVRHLILDDIGAEHDTTGWWNTWLLGVLDTRYSNRRPTSAASNTPNGIEARIARRLTEFAFRVELTHL